MVKKPSLRRSCAYCRARKIACSGGRICTACRDRSIECVYDLETAKGRRPRPKKTTTSAQPTSTAGSAGQNSRMLEEGQTGEEVRPNSTTSPNTNLGVELDAMFRENFSDGPTAPAPSNLFHDRVATFNRRLASGRVSGVQGQGRPSVPVGSLSYAGFLALLMQDLVETVVGKFGVLGCHPFFGVGERYFRACMLLDSSRTMFDHPSPSIESDVLAEYTPHLIAQYLEVWFGNHPLSILISKSLLLRDLRSRAANRVLLAILLADAHHFTDDSDKGDVLLRWAISQLPSISSDKAKPELSTAQIALLLGWYHVCRGSSRRALCYTGYACRVITKLKSQLHESPVTRQPHAHINGIDQGVVEAELIHNICWVVLALTVWSFLQMDMPLADILPARLMQTLPASSEPESSILQLDRATCNLSTLKPQLSSLQSIWLLAHITSLSTHLYALYPPPPRTPPAPQPWQQRIQRQLNNLLHRGRSLPQVCTDAREALRNVIAIVEQESIEECGRAGLLASYQAVALHLLFPRDTLQTLGLTEQLIQDLVTTMQDLEQLFPAIQATARHDPVASTRSPSLHFYILGLDALGRALIHVLTLWDRAPKAEQQAWRDRLIGLLEGAQAMQDLFKRDTLLQDHRWRLVKRLLKTACRGLGEVVAGCPALSSQSSSAGGMGLITDIPNNESMPSPQIAQDTDPSWAEWLQDSATVQGEGLQDSVPSQGEAAIDPPGFSFGFDFASLIADPVPSWP
ncbi:uncharacterized protein BO97DRAFT_400720 [Aspergillus homomorphus CBS 101889]|uniref:Zn(2)-C6 fungal-type domain-containing protein n=1 Tax=Aspergillus homomorphus (strain CBS 101889) TaxID=1450537 RepID=A0A395HLE0_ASPHC|nr:hypothetical protein BO97DRAFT_400720 [Aspergillus homomorphus CBS 101889]RAL07094.1 hypothetical protein BO97DRAFT_400720 [Aspergillus homomorphus CBS 101889]